jgi:hypothetical protein
MEDEILPFGWASGGTGEESFVDNDGTRWTVVDN